MKNTPFIGVAGNIGVGKTTFSQIIADHYDWDAYFESVVDNPYLSDFYDDMKRWSFNLQIYFLQHRFKTHMDMANSSRGVIQDRTIYEDVEIFARNLSEMRLMTKRDWSTYRNLFANMTSFLPKPDLIVYLRASIDTLIIRIKKRSRDFEKDIDPEYLYRLNILYEQWMKRIDDVPVLVVNSDNFNIFQDVNKLNNIYRQIEEHLGIDVS